MTANILPTPAPQSQQSLATGGPRGTDGPRERLFTLGAASLSDAELLAVALGSGTQGVPVHVVASHILRHFSDLPNLARASCAEMQDIGGIGPARAALLHAVFELGRRAAGSRPCHGRKLGRSADVWTHWRARLASAPVEEFWALGLDVRHRVVFESCLARGSLSAVEVHPRDAFRPLIKAGVAAVIFCHNHPSGDPAPSREDIALTSRLREVGHLCGIAVLDHVVVAADGYTSLAERGWV